MVAIGDEGCSMRIPGDETVKAFLKAHATASNNVATCYPRDTAVFLQLAQSLGLNNASPKRTTTHWNNGNENSNRSSEKAEKSEKERTSVVAFAQTAEEFSRHYPKRHTTADTLGTLTTKMNQMMSLTMA